VSFGRDRIEAEYRRLGYTKGWSFMGTPEANLKRAKIAIVGLNPGGGGPGDGYAYQGLWDSPGGNAYFIEKWGANDTETPLQGQVRAWHSLLGIGADESLCAQFVPFRSPNWRSLERQQEAVAFAEALWSWVLSITPATLLLTMGKLPAWHLQRLLGARLVGQGFPTGWGRQTIDVYDSPSGRRIVAMPHPSRYTLFNRANGLSAPAEASLRAAAGKPAGPE